MNEEARPFEEYKEMIKDMRKEEMIKGLYDLSKNIIEKGKEIEKLNKEIIGLNNCIIEFHSEFCNKQAEINRLNNIINKTIESVQEHYDNSYSTDDVNDIGSGAYDDLMEILKGENKE